jgi:DNA-binding transcriptional LysR family regulator
MNWDDLRMIAAVREEGTYAGAAAQLRMDVTTVGRRIARIQRALGVTLFEAVNGVRTPTKHCETVLAHIEAMAGHAKEIGRVGESLPGAVGHFRIASTISVAEDILAPRACMLLENNPGLSLQFLTSSENVKFARWEADIAIRLRKPDKGDFMISKLTDVRLYFVEPAVELAVEPVVCGYPQYLDQVPEAQFLKAKRLDKRARCITDNVRIIRKLIEAHRAVGILPEYVCGDMLTDERLKVTLLPRHRDVWLLMQNHLRRDRAARVVIDWVRQSFLDVVPR